MKKNTKAQLKIMIYFGKKKEEEFRGLNLIQKLKMLNIVKLT